MKQAPKIRLYISSAIKKGTSITLLDEQRHYLCNVMRCTVGCCIRIFNAENGEWIGQITTIDKKRVFVDVMEQFAPFTNKSIRPIIKHTITVAFVPLKTHITSLLIQKITELGVDNIQPILASRSVIKSVNNEKLQKIAMEATEQSGRIFIPKIEPMICLDHFLNSLNGQYLLFCDVYTESFDVKRLCSFLQNNKELNKEYILLIGPEGDFTKDEITQIKKYPLTFSLSLGNFVLRAETAAITSLVMLQTTLKMLE